ncbi:MAG: hypothetical protein WCW34_03505 [Patescibacteria group bacterium]
MYRMLICLCCAMVLGCSSAPSRPMSEEDIKLCVLEARAHPERGDEAALCYDQKTRIQMARAAAQKADEARQPTCRNDNELYACAVAPSVRNDVTTSTNSRYYDLGRFQDSQGNIFHHIRVNCDHYFCAVDAECLKKDREDQCLRTDMCCAADKLSIAQITTPLEARNDWDAGLREIWSLPSGNFKIVGDYPAPRVRVVMTDGPQKFSVHFCKARLPEGCSSWKGCAIVDRDMCLGLAPSRLLSKPGVLNGGTK